MSPDESDFSANDILFTCPRCGKSLVIDAAAAGMMAPCTDCGEMVQVPYPSENPDSDATIAQLDDALQSTTAEVERLRAENETLRERKAFLEHQIASSAHRFERASALLDEIQTRLDELGAIVAESREGRPV